MASWDSVIIWGDAGLRVDGEDMLDGDLSRLSFSLLLSILGDGLFLLYYGGSSLILDMIWGDGDGEGDSGLMTSFAVGVKDRGDFFGLKMLKLLC